jgi:tetratricopeptide (TPR) repeat protein
VLRDQKRFDQAIEASGAFRRWAGQELGGDYATLEAITLLEGTIYLHHAQALSTEGKHQEADALRMQSRKPLIELAASYPEDQDRLYRTVYQLMGKVSDVQGLDAFEKNAYISGLIGDVQRLSGDEPEREKAENAIANAKLIDGKLNEAIRVAELLIAEESVLAQQFRPATLYNLAICLHEKGKSNDAVDALMKLAKEYPHSDRARRASGLACSIAFKCIGSATEASLGDARALFVRAAQAMLEAYPDDPESARWRIPLGHVLDRTGEHAAAAKVYQEVSATDQGYLDALFLQLQARRKAANLDRDKSGRMNFKVVHELIQEAIHFAEQSRSARDESNDPDRRRILNEYAIGSELMAADLEASPVVGASAKALQRVVTLREKSELTPETLGHALRVQILALQSLGELDEASALVETYLNGDSDRAGAVVQGLIRSIQKEIAEDRRAGKTDDAKVRADEALQLTQQLDRWARRREGALVSANEWGLTLLLAESYLDAERFDDALNHFDLCVGKFEGDTAEERRQRSRLALGRAEALYQLERYAEAINRFDEIWRGSPGNTEIWWRALVRNLQCHDALQTPPAEILTSIQQHRRLYPKMEYVQVKAELDSLEKKLLGQLAERPSAVER